MDQVDNNNVYFNPRLHYGRRHENVLHHVSETLISIHASTMGGDVLRLISLKTTS